MSDGKKVLYIENDYNYPYYVTNSRSVCNLLISTLNYPLDYDDIALLDRGILDMDFIKAQEEGALDVFNALILPQLEMIDCEVIWVDTENNTLVFEDYIKREHFVVVD